MKNNFSLYNRDLKLVDISKGTELAKCTFQTMLQDAQDFIWLGTNLGLVRYDGYKFKIFKPDFVEWNNPGEFSIECMYEHPSGKLIIFADMLAIYEFDIIKENFKILECPVKGSSFNHNNIIMDKNENFWIGTNGNGLFKLDINLKLLDQFKAEDMRINYSVNCNYITCLYEDRINNLLYIGTANNGLNIYNYDLNSFTYFKHEEDNLNSLSNNFVNHILRDKKQNLWVCTSNGLNLFNEKKSEFKKYFFRQSANVLHTICEDEDGLLWVGTLRDGILCFDPVNEKFHQLSKYKSSENNELSWCITRLVKDKTNVIWIGSTGCGIGILNCKQKRFQTIRSNLNFISSIYEDNEKNLWIGTHNRGLYKASKKKLNEYVFDKHEEFMNVLINGIFEYTNKFLFVNCSQYGICKIDMTDNRKRFIDKNVFRKYYSNTGLYVLCSCIDTTKPNLIWISISTQSLVQFDLESESIIENSIISDTLKNIPVVSLYMDSNGILWIGTIRSGLFKFDVKENAITNFGFDNRDPDGISHSIIYSICEDSKQNIWIGTENGILNKLEKNGNKFKKYDPGIMSPMESIVVDSKGDLWISFMQGILKFCTGDSVFNNYSVSDGLLEDGYNFAAFCKTRDETFYFGGDNGITYFKPEEITTNEYLPNIVITDFQIFYDSVKPSPENPFLKKSISYAKEITLTHKESVITFEFAALIYNDPKKNKYAYKMEGFDEEWVYCGTRRTATYTNLDPGEYTFRVKGSNNDGLWNEEGTSIKIIITPPWYKTVLFKGLVGLSVIGSIGSFYRQRIQKLNKEKTQQEEFTKKLIESQENERKRVAAELHDSLGQDLLIIKNKALVSIKKNEPDKFREQMNEISELTSTTLNDVREISYNLRPYELDRLGLTKTITSMIERANNSTNISFTGNIDDIDKVFIPEIEINIYRIIQESLNNVIKHSGAKEVIVSVLKKDKEIVLNISDDGKGFDIRKYKMNSKRKGFGLKGIEERVRLLNGEFDIEPEVGRGTVIRIIIPLSK